MVASTEVYSVLARENEANARRVVACVNACAKIPSDILEGGFEIVGALLEERTERLDEAIRLLRELVLEPLSGRRSIAEVYTDAHAYLFAIDARFDVKEVKE